MIESRAAERSQPKISLEERARWQLPDGPDAAGCGGTRSVPSSPRSALCCAMGQFYGPGTYNEQRPPEEPVFASTELPNERWRRWASQRASASLPTEPCHCFEIAGLPRRTYF